MTRGTIERSAQFVLMDMINTRRLRLSRFIAGSLIPIAVGMLAGLWATAQFGSAATSYAGIIIALIGVFFGNALNAIDNRFSPATATLFPRIGLILSLFGVTFAIGSFISSGAELCA